MNLFSFALRNLGRNRSRTAVTILAMAFAGFIMIFYASLMEGFLKTLERNAVGMDLGEIQIHAPEYRDNPDLYKRIREPESLIERLDEQGLSGAARLYGYGLAASERASSAVQLRGVDPTREQAVTLLHRHVAEGAWLDVEEPDGIVIGRKLARTLGTKTGDEIVLVTQAADGSMADRLYRVRGILKSVGEGIDRGGLFLTESAFRELMAIPEGAHEIVLVRREASVDLDMAARQTSGSAPGLEVQSWRQLQPLLARMIDISAYSLLFMILVTYTAVGMVILNAMLMSVFERIKEFGILKAVGLLPRQVLLLIFFETVLQTAGAGLVAALLGWPVSRYFETHGIDLSAWGETGSVAGIALEPVWYTQVTPQTVVTPLIILLGVAILASVYPAVKAAVIRPVRAIYDREG